MGDCKSKVNVKFASVIRFLAFRCICYICGAQEGDLIG